MSDSPKIPTQANFGPMVFTAVASSSVGDKIGDALSVVLTWLVQLSCHCILPDAVTSAFHTLCLETTVVLAFVLHFYVIKSKGE